MSIPDFTLLTPSEIWDYHSNFQPAIPFVVLLSDWIIRIELTYVTLGPHECTVIHKRFEAKCDCLIVREVSFHCLPNQ